MLTAQVAWFSTSEIADAVAGGDVGASDVVAQHLERIARLNPRIGAYVHVDGSARAGSGPLAGVTIAVKDTQPVLGMTWTYGSRKWRDRVAGVDAIAVGRARSHGISILGKTNLPELAASVGTVNEIFPPTQNPWRQGFTPGGSSGGSGAAVAAGLCTFAYGDDMGGSIRIPASCCGVLGLRPSSGRIPVLDPDPTHLSTPGPLARSAGDLRAAFAVMTGESPPRPSEAGPLRVAVVDESPLEIDPGCRAAVRRAADALAAAGHQVERLGWDPEPVARAYQVVRPASVSRMPGEPAEYGEAAGRLIAQGREVPVADYLQALEDGMRAAAPLREAVQPRDAILTPTLGQAPMAIDEVPPFLSEHWIGYTQFVLPVSFAGLPAVSVPAGVSDGLPVGVQLVGKPYDEWRLLDVAAALEAEPGFGFQRPPGFE